jgi:apolipoprotein N-acyltransferase
MGREALRGGCGLLAYSQTDVPAVIQLASLTGLWGISFIVSLVPVTLAVAWRSRRKPKILFLGLALAALPLALALVFGAARLERCTRGAAHGRCARRARRHVLQSRRRLVCVALYCSRARLCGLLPHLQGLKSLSLSAS